MRVYSHPFFFMFVSFVVIWTLLVAATDSHEASDGYSEGEGEASSPSGSDWYVSQASGSVEDRPICLLLDPHQHVLVDS